jgi:hypothetical protein
MSRVLYHILSPSPMFLRSFLHTQTDTHTHAPQLSSYCLRVLCHIISESYVISYLTETRDSISNTTCDSGPKKPESGRKSEHQFHNKFLRVTLTEPQFLRVFTESLMHSLINSFITVLNYFSGLLHRSSCRCCNIL